MAEPVPDVTMLAKVLEWAWAGVLALGGLVYKAQNDKIQAKADEQDKQIATAKAEQLVQRTSIDRIYDKIESVAGRAEDRHRELLTALHHGLERKADK